MSSLAHFIRAEEYFNKKELSYSLNEYEYICNLNKGNIDELFALFGLFRIYSFYQRDTLLAKAVLTQMNLKYPDEEITFLAMSLNTKGIKYLCKNKSSLAKLNNEDTENPKIYKLSQNYPNPFNPNTKISYSIKEPAFVNLKIYSVLGEEVRTTVNSYHSAGNYKAEFNAKELSSGMYIYRIEAKGDNGSISFTDVKKMILVK